MRVLPNKHTEPLTQIDSLSKSFRVSQLVILRRLRDLGKMDEAAFQTAYRARLDSFQKQEATDRAKLKEREGGPSYYELVPARVSTTFARAVIESARTGETLYRDAYTMLGLKSVTALERLRDSLGEQ